MLRIGLNVSNSPAVEILKVPIFLIGKIILNVKKGLPENAFFMGDEMLQKPWGIFIPFQALFSQLLSLPGKLFPAFCSAVLPWTVQAFAHCPYTLPFNHGKASDHKQSACLTKNSPLFSFPISYHHFISCLTQLAPAHSSPDFTYSMAIIA